MSVRVPGTNIRRSEVRRFLEAIEEICQKYIATLRLEPILERIIDEAMGLSQADAGSIMLITQDRRELVVTAARGPQANIVLGRRQPVDGGVADRDVSDGTLVPNGRVEQRRRRGRLRHDDNDRSLVIPLQVAGRLVGLLSVSTEIERDDLALETISTLGILAHQAAILIDHSRMSETLALNEQRLDLFVDRFLRLPARQRELTELTPDQFQPLLREVMRRAVKEFLVGAKPLSDAMAEMSDPPTPQEQQVLSSIVEGLTNKQIGERLGLSPNTVKDPRRPHLREARRKRSSQAAVTAVRMGVASTPLEMGEI